MITQCLIHSDLNKGEGNVIKGTGKKRREERKKIDKMKMLKRYFKAYEEYKYVAVFVQRSKLLHLEINTGVTRGLCLEEANFYLKEQNYL